MCIYITKKSYAKDLENSRSEGVSVIWWLTYPTVALYEFDSKRKDFFFSIGIITDTGTCIIHQNEAGCLWITSLLLNIVTVSLNSNVPL